MHRRAFLAAVGSTAGCAALGSTRQSTALRWTFDGDAPLARHGVAVGDDAVYVAEQARDGSGGRVVALDSRSGEVRWERETPDGASAAAGSGGAYLWVDDRVVAYDAATGDERWSLAEPRAFPPVVADGTVYVSTADGVRAVDAATGDRRWVTPLRGSDSGTLIGTPVRYDGDAVYVSAQGGRVVALDAASGAERWRVRSGENLPIVAVGEGGVYVGSDGGDPVRLSMADESSGEWRWRVPFDGAAAFPRPAAGRLFASVATGEGWFVAGVDPSSGAVEWRRDGVDAQVASADAAFGAISGREVVALDADGSIRWRVGMGAADAASPSVALASDAIVASADRSAYGFDAATGEKRWTLDAAEAIRTAATADGWAYLLAERRLYALDA